MTPDRGLPLVVAVVIDFNGLLDTVACVESLLRQEYHACRIVVVDNGSSADEAAAIQARFGDAVTTIRAARNGGYGAGANAGIRWGLNHGAAFVWVLNNDTLVEPRSLADLVDGMTRDASIGIASPQIRTRQGPDAPDGVWYAGGEVDLSAGATRHFTVELPPREEPVDTGFVTGTAPIFRRELLEGVGAFWEPLFLFWEDTDLCLRAQRAGWRTCVIPRAWIFHHVHGSMTDSLVARYHYRNALIVARRHGTPRQVAAAVASIGRLMVRLWAAAILRRRPRPTAAFVGYLAGLRALVGGVELP